MLGKGLTEALLRLALLSPPDMQATLEGILDKGHAEALLRLALSLPLLRHVLLDGLFGKGLGVLRRLALLLQHNGRLAHCYNAVLQRGGGATVRRPRLSRTNGYATPKRLVVSQTLEPKWLRTQKLRDPAPT